MGAFDGGAENRLVAQMDTIEVADGQDAGVAISCIARGPGLRVEKADRRVDLESLTAICDCCGSPG